MLSTILLIFGLAALGALAAIWWWRQGRYAGWLVLAMVTALGLSYLSSFVFRVAPYLGGCTGYCSGWWGHPIPTHVVAPGGAVSFRAGAFVLNAAIYYVIVLGFSVIVAWLAAQLQWRQRRWRWRLGFIAIVIFLPLALLPNLATPPAPKFSGESQRLANNALRAWRWQLRSGRPSDRRLALEDVRPHPDGERHRVCFRSYTWFYMPHGLVYVDLEPAGVRATGGGAVPMGASCWVQP